MSAGPWPEVYEHDNVEELQERIAALEAELAKVKDERDTALEDACAVVKNLQEANAERDATLAKLSRLRGVFRVNMLRAYPHMSHSIIDDAIKAAEDG